MGSLEKLQDDWGRIADQAAKHQPHSTEGIASCAAAKDLVFQETRISYQRQPLPTLPSNAISNYSNIGLQQGRQLS